jgi:hypothetical protein
VREASNEKVSVRDLHSEASGRGSSRVSAHLVLVGRDDRRMDGITNRLGKLRGVKNIRWQLERGASHFE